MTEMEKQVERSILRVMVSQENWVYPALVLSPRDFKIFTKYDQYDRITNYRVVAEKSFKDHYFEVYRDPKQPDGVMKFSHPVLGTKEVRVPL